MEETTEPRVLPAEPRRRKLRIKWSDVLIFAAIIAVIAGLSAFIINRLALKHEVAAAKPTADKILTAMSKQDVKVIVAMGDKTFQADHTIAELNGDLTFKTTPPITFAALYGDSKPTVEQQVVANNAKGQHVSIIYRYDKLKVPFYVRIDTTKPPHGTKWYLQALSASPNESKLLSPSN